MSGVGVTRVMGREVGGLEGTEWMHRGGAVESTASVDAFSRATLCAPALTPVMLAV